MLTPDLFGVEHLLPPLRPLSEFLAYTSVRGHKSPLKNRFVDNILFYQTNYLLINMFILVLSVSLSPLVFIIAPLVFSTFYFLVYHKTNHFILFNRIRITKNATILSCLFILVALVIASGRWGSLFIGYLSTMFTILGHASLTDRKRQSTLYNENVNTPSNRIFDPEELIKRDEMERRRFQQVNTPTTVGYSTSNRYNTPSPTNATFSSVSPNSNISTTPNVGVSTTNAESSDVTESKASREARREKLKQTRQRIKENYGLE
ncbi:hypothetical protein ABK040_010108 [Willaertia magna]